MKTHFYIYGLFALLILAGCNKEEKELLPDPKPSVDVPQNVPEGYFVASFSNIMPESRTAVSGPDTRVQHIRYLVYNSSGQFVKERIILSPGTTANWPFASVRDTLPRGSYTAVFLGNVEKTLFPYSVGASGTQYTEVLQNYKGQYSDARVFLPNVEFKANTEYYWAKVPFSDANPTPNVLLQRIIDMLNVHRNFVDARDALNKLTNNIVTNVGYKNLIRTQVQGLLTTEVKKVVGAQLSTVVINLLGGVDAIVNPIVAGLVEPVTDTLYNRLLNPLVDKIGTALTGNADQSGLLGFLGEVLNPWESGNAHSAIVEINNFPQSVDFNLTVQDKFTGTHLFRYDFVNDSFWAQKCIYIKGFSGLFDIRKIHIIKQGLISGVIFDGIVDGPFLLNGTFVDINKPLSYTLATNYRYKADYSFIDLGLTSYNQQVDGNHSLTVSVKLSEIANIDGILGGVVGRLVAGIPLVGDVLGLLLSPLKAIVITTPLNLPVLGIENLSLSAGWSPVTSY